MSIRVALRHQTHYRFDRLVNLSPHVIRLRPAPHCRTPIVGYSLTVRPDPHFLNWQQDPFGNFQARLVFPEPAREFLADVEVIAEMTVINPFDFFLEPAAMEVPFDYEPSLLAELQPYLRTEPATERFRDFMAGVPLQSKVTVDFLVDVNRYVQTEVAYLIRLEPGVQSCDQTLERRSGSCRDSAWLLAQVFRHLGMASRFVSGYLIQLTADQKAIDGPSGTAVDFTDLHAWTEVYLPGAGWVGLDPTSGLLAGEGHIPLAATPEPSSAAPITGATDKCEVEFDFQMSITRILESPRVTKPCTEPQWQSILQLGEQVDREIAAGPEVLTMGGEPTFVAIDNRDEPEWNSAALGPHKRKLAGELFLRLAKKFAPGPLLHYGQGKWYPGESLPRWALGCYWRKDGESIWNNPELYAADDVNLGAAAPDAYRFVTRLTQVLEVEADHAIPGYEDVFYYQWKARKIPSNLDPLTADFEKDEDRRTLQRLLTQGLDRVVGYALPLKPDEANGPRTRWRSGAWFFRQEHMFLTPGDSPMGLRLPLDSLPWVAPEDAPGVFERDPFEDRGDLPRPAGGNGFVHNEGGTASRLLTIPTIHRQYAGDPAYAASSSRALGNGTGTAVAAELAPSPAPSTATETQVAIGQSAAQLVRTAMCIEPRDGVIHVFMPPLEKIEEYLDLVAAIEETAAHLDMPVRIEGYTPPYDYRVENFKVTPDPGVIEVNLQPAASFREVVGNMSVLYEEARQCRLTAEKFMVDGRHTGTCGGNHIVIGGPSPKESPFLKRPDLLRSFLAFWNNRPSLSYLFSGLFIGPTSQAPRVDEARHESIYELENAFGQLPPRGEYCPPWLVDRLFRHLLVDLSGNTHRAEFCIDKLYSPDSSTGRLGLVEFRGFEMPPHEQMNVAQYLLIRALLMRFWNQPYDREMVRWETSLHDRFMLPHFVSDDFSEVLQEMHEAGYNIDPAWFAPHFEFRFPLIGEVTHHDVHLELRQALEPWHVLGEEPGGGGTARYVDSSVERVQVKVRGMTDSRHVVSCNGRRVPLHPTGVRGEFVAGVRFRAWQPPSCLHPTIGVHAPLVFDVYDTWNNRSIGGCKWHVSHPGGRSHETFPINANEAEGRRTSRFTAIGHTHGVAALPPSEFNRDFPFTLDLRRPVVEASYDR